jgi:biopolymer transport protein ExbD
MESKFSMAMPPRRWVGYALLAAGLALLFDTCTFFLTNWSPLKVPMYGPNELAAGCLSTIAGVLVLAASTLKRTPLRIQVGAALIVAAASIYGGWEWWMATRTWVPLYMPVSLAKGHIRSPEFKINLDAGFWIFVEIETKVDDEGVSCLTGYASDYCQKNGVRQLHASWTLSDRGRVVARSSTDGCTGSIGGMVTRGCYLGAFSVPAGNHFILDIDFTDDNSHFNGGNPRLAIEQSYWGSGEEGTVLVLFAIFLSAIGTALFVSGIVESSNRRGVEQAVSLTSIGPIAGGFQWQTEPATKDLAPERRHFVRASTLIGLTMTILGMMSFVIAERWIDTRIFVPVDIPVSLAAGHIRTGPFKINLKDEYQVRIKTGWESYFDPNCPTNMQLPKADWFLYKDGQLVKKRTGSEPFDYLGSFEGENGTYELDLEIQSGSACLDPGHPRLLVYTNKVDYEDDASPMLWAAGLSITFGASLVLLGVIAGSTESHLLSNRISNSESVGLNFQWAQRLPLRSQFSSPPAFALVAAPVLITLIIIFMIMQPQTSEGLYVSIRKPDVSESTDVHDDTVIVRIVDAAPGKVPAIYINSRLSSWGTLSNDLKDQVKIHPQWVVYVQAGPNLSWADVVRAIEVAKAIPAKVVLLPSDTRNASSWSLEKVVVNRRSRSGKIYSSR